MKNRLILSFVFTFFILISKSDCSENPPGVLFGFIDNGYFTESGTILLDINNTLLKNIDHIFSSVPRKKREEVEYAEIPFAIASEFFLGFLKQSFQVYSEKGYLGDFRIDKIVDVSHIGSAEGPTLFAKLNFRKQTDKLVFVIAKAKSGSSQERPCKVYLPVKLSGQEGLRIEKILADKLKEAKTKWFDPEFGSIEKQKGRPFQFIADPKVYKLNPNVA